MELRVAGLKMLEILVWSGSVGESLIEHNYLFLLKFALIFLSKKKTTRIFHTATIPVNVCMDLECHTCQNLGFFGVV